MALMPHGIAGHLKSVQMNFLQNHWSHIYDFTPKDGNWSYLPPVPPRPPISR